MINFTKKIHGALRGINELLAQPVGSYCRLVTGVDAHTLSADDGSLVTVIEISGSLSVDSPESFQNKEHEIAQKLTAPLSGKGHTFEIAMIYNPNDAAVEIHEALDPSRKSTRALGINIDDFLNDTEDILCQHCAAERVCAVLWTHPTLLAQAEKKKASKEMFSRVGKSLRSSIESQPLELWMENIVHEHQGYVQTVLEGLRNSEIMANVLEVHDALWLIRHAIDPSWTSKDWRPLLPGDPFTLQLPDKGYEWDAALSCYPSIRDQIWPREAEVEDRQIIKIGDQLHAPVVMTIGPQNPQPFSRLFSSLKSKRIPWAMKYTLDGDGMASLGMKGFAASMLQVGTMRNRMINEACKQMNERLERGGAVVGWKIAFNTWTESTEGAIDRVKGQSSRLVSAIQGWGACDCCDVSGDPLLGVSGTIPGLLPTSPAPNAAAPLEDIVGMLPITRPASPWREGSVLFRSPDGKILPFTPMSSNQAAWIELGCGPMGSGKSLFLNCMNWGYCIQPGLTSLPYLSILDVGPSSSGLIAMLKTTLPPHDQHKVAYHRLRMEKSYAINVFDTPLGCRRPLPNHKSFLVNLLSLFATPLNELAPADGIPGIASKSIEMAYEEMADGKNPRLYSKGVDPAVDEAVKKIGLPLDTRTSWWEIVDGLFDAGLEHEAMLAQRYAVPVLKDIAAQVTSPQIREVYQMTNATGEKIHAAFQRHIFEAIEAYPILASTTRFDIGDAHIVSLDLDEVAPKGGADADRQSGVMYMVGRHVVAGKFFLQEEDITLMPDRYRSHHKERIQHIRRTPKRLCYDEVHRVVGNSSISKQLVADLTQAARESRKWNLAIGLYTQHIDDFPDVLVELATSVFVLGCNATETADRLQERLGLNDQSRYLLMRLGKPGPKGANLLAVLKCDSGTVQQVYTNTVGQQMLWAFSTTTEDAVVRNALYGRIGTSATLSLLSKTYPGGIKVEVERRKRAQIYDELGGSKDVLNELIEELVSTWHRTQKKQIRSNHG